jgi:DNA protecting protein DprA
MIKKEYLITLLELYYYNVDRVWDEILKNDLSNMDHDSFYLFLSKLIKDKRQNSLFTLNEIQSSIKKTSRIMDYCLNSKIPIEILTFEDDRFPKQRVETLSKSEKPIVLYALGDTSLLKQASIAIIGTREVDPEYFDIGIKVSKELSYNYVIVSGLALGCDTAAHQGALAGSKKTIAVLANGLNTIYPSQNKTLANQIYVSGGLLISEYPPYTAIKPYYFARRDRLQASFSDAILVLETGIKSGTMITVGFGKEYSKPIYVIPPLGLEGLNDKGNHELLKDSYSMPFDISSLHNFSISSTPAKENVQIIKPYKYKKDDLIFNKITDNNNIVYQHNDMIFKKIPSNLVIVFEDDQIIVARDVKK